MKLIEMKCKNCGAILKVEEETKDINCQYCHAKYKLDDEMKHIKFDEMEQSGYEFEKGRIRAQQEQNNNSNNVNNKKKNNKTLWLILAWIFLLPFTATYFIVKNEKLDKKKKIIIIATMWILFLVIAYTNPSEKTQNTELNNKNSQNQIETINEEKLADDLVVNEFIKSFKNNSTMELTDIEKGNISTKYFVHINGKYTELLNATNQSANYFHIVINGNGNTKEEIENITKVYKEIVKVLDSTISDEKINETIEEHIKPEEATRDFEINENISVKYYPLSGVGGHDCRIEIDTKKYNK